MRTTAALLSEIEAALVITLPETVAPAVHDWDAAERSVGIRFPDDYKLFIERFGAIMLDEFLLVWSPFCRVPAFDLIREAEALRDHMREMLDVGADPAFFTPAPAPEGLFPWGTTPNGDNLLWRTSDSGEWLVEVTRARSEARVVTGRSMIEFLHGVVTGSAPCAMFPADFPSCRPIPTQAFG